MDKTYLDENGKLAILNELPEFANVASFKEGGALPDLPKWSGEKNPPPVGADVTVRMNQIGKSKVLGYFVEHGWLGIYVQPYDPPKWYLDQNGRTPCHVFGIEIK